MSILLSPIYQQQLIATLSRFVEVVPVDVSAEPLWWRWVSVQRRLPAIVRRQRPDILFAPADNYYRPISVPMVMLVRNLSIYASGSSLPLDRLRGLAYRVVRKPLAVRAMRRAEHLVFVSDAARREVQRLTGVTRLETSIVHHGVDEIFRMRDSTSAEFPFHYVLGVSTIAPHKDFTTLVRAFALAVAQGECETLHLVIAGQASDHRSVEELKGVAQSAGVASRVHLLGQVEHERLACLYANAAVLVSSSRLETFGNTLLEAMAAGCPVVASRIPASMEVCDDAALYFSTGDDAEAARCLRSILFDSSIRESLVVRGLERAQHFSWRVSAARLFDIFRDVADRHVSNADAYRHDI